jgi:tetratricopeptide (TPR) repeat protein
MTDQSHQQPVPRQDVTPRKFHVMTTRVVSNASGFELANAAALLSRERSVILTPPDGERGFRDYPVPPLFVADGHMGRLHWDLEQYCDYWFVSERMKSLLEELDRDAFVFLPCEVQLPDGTGAPRRWLCDVVRVLDAVDEETSEVTIGAATDGQKFYRFGGHLNLFFKPDVVASRRFFRLTYAPFCVICDEDVKNACKAADLKGLAFIAQGRPSRRPDAFRFHLDGKQCRERGDLAAALVAFGEAVRLGRRKKSYSEFLKSRGDTYFQLKEFDRAIADYDEIIRLNRPDAAERRGAPKLATRLTWLAHAYHHRGEAFAVKGDVARAGQDLESARTLGYDRVLTERAAFSQRRRSDARSNFRHKFEHDAD